MVAVILSQFPDRLDPALPRLDRKGNLPAGDFAPSARDFESTFVGTGRRRAIYEGWNRHRGALWSAGLPEEARQLLNGSFTTAKAMPGDLDLAVEVRVPGAGDLHHPALALLLGPAMKGTYDCDAYPIVVLPPDDPAYEEVTVAAIQYWTKWFGRDREGRPKGRVWATVGGFRDE